MFAVEREALITCFRIDSVFFKLKAITNLVNSKFEIFKDFYKTEIYKYYAASEFIFHFSFDCFRSVDFAQTPRRDVPFGVHPGHRTVSHPHLALKLALLSYV